MAVTFTQARKSTCNLGELVSFSGGFSPLDTSGLMPFEGTVTVLAKNRDGFCWGQKVIITVEGMGTGWLPELYVKSVSPLDIKTGEISVNVGCVISLLSNKTFDDFKEEEDFLTDAIPGADKQIRYWWQQWELLNRDGTAIEENPEESPIIKDVTITSIVQEMCRHLNLPCSGGVAGKKRLPYTPSGNLLSEIGNLIFNSESPSYAYSDHRGSIRITPIDFTPNNGFSITLGQSELDKDYNPVDGGVEPIKRLVVTYTLQELEAECDKTVQRCYTSTESVPGMDITGDPDMSAEVEAEITTTCEWVECGLGVPPFRRLPHFKPDEYGSAVANVKATKITKRAMPGYVFPGTTTDPTSMKDSYFELKNEYYDAQNGLLRVEVMWKQEPIGIVFGGWINSHEHWEIGDQLAPGMGNSVHDFNYALVAGRGPVYPAAMPSGRAGTNKDNMTLTDSEYTETFYYYNDADVLTGKVTMTWMPISKVLSDFNGNSFNGIGEAIVDFDVPPTNNSQYVQFDFEILEKDQWVDLIQILTPDPQKPTEKRAVFSVYSGGAGGTGSFTGGTVITSIVTETWDYSCAGGTKHMVEEKVLKYEYASEIESNLQAKYAEPLNVILNMRTYDNSNVLKKQSKSTLTTETPNKFITVRMWGTRQEGFDEYLRRNNLDEYDDTFYTPYPDDWSLLAGGEGYTMQYDNYDIIPNFISRHDLLKLVTKRTITNSSNEGGQSPASSEFLSCALTDTVKWKDVPGVLEVDGFLCHTGRYDPPTEVMDLGLVYDISYVRKLANTIMNMRQAQSIQYELICKLDPQVCGFPPVRTIRVKESCQTNADLVFIGNSQGITIGGDEMVVSWDLWQIGYNPGTTTANWSYPPAEYLVGDIGDGTGIVIAPPPQYVIIPDNYNGNGVITIGSDTIQGTITQVPNYVSTPTILDNTWVTIISGDETINTWVSSGKIEVPSGFAGDVLVISGNDTLTQTIIETPDRIELPSGYYPSDNIFIDDTIPASLQSDDTVPVYITNPIIIDGDDTLISAWPTVVGVGGIARLKVQTYTDYLRYGRGMRSVMVRGD